ncbi:MAG: acetyl-CoA carboxylase biotin carboxyl carrier protein subunit [Candidatus Paceibacterota bacterium]|jgi:biotin carboxyl carrier protein
MDFKIKIKNKEYLIGLKEERGKVRIKIGNKEFVFGSKKGEIPSEGHSSLVRKDVSKKDIISSLSGIVTSVFVKEGEIIKAGQKVLILSAMKMENEIVSESEGKIKRILVKENQQVKDEEILIVLE